MLSGKTLTLVIAGSAFAVASLSAAPTQTTPPRTTPQTTPKTTPQTTPKPKPKPTPSPAASKLSAADKAFLQAAAVDGMTEIELADIALAKATNNDVKALASKIKDDHTRANADLKALAGQKNVTLPDALDKTHANMKDRFTRMDAKTFDRSYVSAMVTDHRKAVADFTARTKSADPDVKAFAEKTLTALKDHLQRAESLQKSIK